MPSDNASTQSETVAGSLSAKIAQYRVLSGNYGGGMEAVYAAEDLKLSGAALPWKFLPEELGKDAKALDRFEREARAHLPWDHPNICVPIFYEFMNTKANPSWSSIIGGPDTSRPIGRRRRVHVRRTLEPGNSNHRWVGNRAQQGNHPPLYQAGQTSS